MKGICLPVSWLENFVQLEPIWFLSDALFSPCDRTFGWVLYLGCWIDLCPRMGITNTLVNLLDTVSVIGHDAQIK